jgi:hypothetical protein
MPPLDHFGGGFRARCRDHGFQLRHHFRPPNRAFAGTGRFVDRALVDQHGLVEGKLHGVSVSICLARATAESYWDPDDRSGNPFSAVLIADTGKNIRHCIFPSKVRISVTFEHAQCKGSHHPSMQVSLTV